jgi:hypothetical protein
MLFELQSEDGFMKKPKHIANDNFLIISELYTLYNKGCVGLKTYIYILLINTNTTGVPYMKMCWHYMNGKKTPILLPNFLVPPISKLLVLTSEYEPI